MSRTANQDSTPAQRMLAAITLEQILVTPQDALQDAPQCAGT